MEGSGFFRREDELKFRGVTSLLQAIGSKDKYDTTPAGPDGAVAKDIEVLLGELTCLTNLLVREHEVVAAVPHQHGQPGQGLVVEPGCSKGIAGTCYITRNFRRDDDIVTPPVQEQDMAGKLRLSPDQKSDGGIEIPPDPSKGTQLRIALYDIEQTKPHPHDPLPDKRGGFREHLQNIIGSLKGIEEPSRGLTGQQSVTPCDPEARAQHVTHLHAYILRSCFKKISTRAGYHCKSFRKPDGREREGNSVADYSGLFRPMPGWKEKYMLALEGFPRGIQEEIDKQNLDRLLSDSGNDPQVDPAKLGEGDWGNNSDISTESIDWLNKYQPNKHERHISEVCSGDRKTRALANNKGFYPTAEGRKAYHEILTTCFWNALLGLKLMSEVNAEISKQLQEETFRVILFVVKWFCLLYHLAYSSPLLEIHLQWLLKISSLTNGSPPLVCGETAAAVLQWLQLITLHTCSVERLVNNITRSRLEKLDFRVLQVSLPEKDEEIEPLGECLERLMPGVKGHHSIEEKLSKRSRDGVAERFSGTWHCEAILLSLYLFSRKCKERLGDPRATLSPRIVATSKRCCPVCKTLLRVVSEELGHPIAVIGSHDTYSACSLPPWLPESFAKKVVDILENQLKATINEMLRAQPGDHQSSQGSTSPDYYEATVNKRREVRNRQFNRGSIPPSYRGTAEGSGSFNSFRGV